MAKATVAVRMYDVGFGDAFLVTVVREAQAWRMLVDCGVHSQGRARPLREVVAAIIADLRAASPDQVPRLDVIVATHHHADHIAGFALDAWEEVEVGEVWVPFVEDAEDPDARALREAHTVAAQQLDRLIRLSARGADRGSWPGTLAAAEAFAINSLGNADAADRLLGRNGRRFATTPTIRYLPTAGPADDTIDTTLPGVRVHVLGPSRDPAQLRRMDPPSSQAWLQLAVGGAGTDAGEVALFSPDFVLAASEAEGKIPGDLVRARKSLRLPQVVDHGDELLSAAAILERAVNNTSIFFVLDVDGTRLLFPGDAQQGAWDHVLDSERGRELLTGIAFYKIGHHGSHNATPKRFVEEFLPENSYAMLPWGLVKRWADSIPKTELLDALAAKQARVIRADAPVADDHVVVHDTLWSEVTLNLP